MHIVDFFPSRGSYKPGEMVAFILRTQSSYPAKAKLVLHVRHLDETPRSSEHVLVLNGGSEDFEINYQQIDSPAGYSATVELFDENGKLASQASTAFDVLPSWTAFPRYGFMVDFRVDRPDPSTAIQCLRRYHINGLQFYDWQYRHDELLAPTENYIDPLGRSMSLASVRRLVEAAESNGMASMPYLAIYGASAKFWREHPESALYDQNGNPIAFGEDFLGLMNPAAGSPWREHLISEGLRALDAIPFYGLHIDQYGEPKQAWDAAGRPVDLPRAFTGFIRTAREERPAMTILFNAVGNWPIVELASAPLDFMYIEIWPPDVRYLDVARIVLEAVRLSKGKPVVIALYIPSDRPENVRQANAVIAACGGTRIELGEDERLLADPYFPKHQAIAPELKASMKAHYDFLVRCGEWMQSYPLPADGRQAWSQADFQPAEITASLPVWAVRRVYPSGQSINLVNFNRLSENLGWDEIHTAPLPCSGLEVHFRTAIRPRKISWDCPEQHSPVTLDFSYDNNQVRFTIPTLTLSGVVFIHE